MPGQILAESVNVCYSARMEETTNAPDLEPGYPSGGARIGPAWREAYQYLQAAGEQYTEGRTLAEEIAPKHELSPNTLAIIMSRMCREGYLQKKLMSMPSTRGNRPRVFYRVPR